eukprot:TRINITY_DN20270_c0_g1_i1.p1 TRINITY_DN20270_c0_g1~~TRINITY_DN20270_c0_g1_i1.p1  ORF type:complete len:146 (-),score=19.32 TRINITY_DN20270_c0_g1_i1:14-451(-)
MSEVAEIDFERAAKRARKTKYTELDDHLIVNILYYVEWHQVFKYSLLSHQWKRCCESNVVCLKILDEISPPDRCSRGFLKRTIDDLMKQCSFPPGVLWKLLRFAIPDFLVLPRRVPYVLEKSNGSLCEMSDSELESAYRLRKPFC